MPAFNISVTFEIFKSVLDLFQWNIYWNFPWSPWHWHTFIAHFNFLGMFFFLSVFSFMNIHDSQDSRERGRLFLLTFLYHFHLLYRHCLHFEDFLISLVIQGLYKSLAFMFFSLERNYHIWQEIYVGKFYRLIWVLS